MANMNTPDPTDVRSSTIGATPPPAPTSALGAEAEPLPTESSAPLIIIDCVMIEVPPGTPATPRPAGRERRIPNDDSAVSP
jgi:hypothetical protein